MKARIRNVGDIREGKTMTRKIDLRGPIVLALAALCSTPAIAAELHVKAGGDLQAALNVAAPGDHVVLPCGAKFVGQFKLPPKAALVTLRSGCSSPLPDRRVTPADASLMATIASGVSAMALDGYDTRNWRLEGLRFEPNVGGTGAVIEMQRAENVTLDRILLVTPAAQPQKRGVLGNGKQITLTRSHIAGIWYPGEDSQCFAAWDGPGPYTIVDNFLECASENILFGGADSSSAANVPADIRIEGNTLTKDLAWKTLPLRQVKNLLELKAAKRVVIRGNLLRHNWAGAQSGFSVLITPRNQDKLAPWTVIEDVLIEGNTIEGIPLGFSLTGYDDLAPSGQTTRITIRDNTITTTGIPFLLQKELGAVSIYRNKIVMGPDNPSLSMVKTTVWKAGEASPREASYTVQALVFADNPSPGSYIHSPTAVNEAALKAYAVTYQTTVPGGGPAPLPVDPAPSPAPDPSAVEIAKLRAELEAERLKLAKLIAYLAAAPSSTRIAQVVAYLRGVVK